MLSRKGWRSAPLSIGRTSQQCLFVFGMLCVATQVGANPVYKCERLKASDMAEDGYYASDINDAGEAVGTAMSYLAIKWNKQREAQVMHRDTFALGTYVNAINNDGIAVGASDIGGPHPEGVTAYKWLPDGNFVKLTKYEGQHTFAEDINDQGVIAGWVSTDGVAEATLWTDSKQTQLKSLELGKSAYAHQLNNHGVVIGAAVKTVDGKEVTRAVRWRDRKVRDLGALPGMDSSDARSINDDGLIVGSSSNADDLNSGTPVAWVNGTIQALNVGGPTPADALSVNRRGEIIGYTSALGAVYWADVNASPLKIEGLIAADKPCRGPDGQAAQLLGVNAINGHGVIAATGRWTTNGSGAVGAFRLTPLKAD